MNTTNRKPLSLFFALSIWATAILLPVNGQAQWPQFSGQVFAIKGYAQGFGYDLVRTGILYSAGQEKTSTDSLAVVDQKGILHAEAVSVKTGGALNSRSVATTASLTNLNFTVGGNRITADAITSNVSARCDRPSAQNPLGGPVVPPGSLSITKLVINNAFITVTGQKNQTVQLPNGKVIINEQSSLVAGNTAFSTVIGLHVIVNGLTSPLADIVFASSNAYSVCECPGLLYGSRTAVARVNLPSKSAALLDSDRIDGGNYDKNAFLPSANIDNLLSVQNARTSMFAQGRRSQTSASFGSISVSALGTTVSAEQMSAVAGSECGKTAGGTSQIQNLKINGRGITISGQPNQVVFDGNAKVVINEQVPLTTTGISVVAVRIYFFNSEAAKLPPVAQPIGDIELASAAASVTCGCP